MAFERFVALDFETTGTDPREDRIVQVGAVRFVSGRPAEELVGLINPERPLPLRIQRLTGINNEMLRSAGREDTVIGQLLEFIEDDPLVAHNAPFDESFLRASLERFDRAKKARFRRADLTFLDTLEMARFVAPMAPNYKLQTLVQEMEIATERGHDALEDARAAGELFCRLLKKLQAFRPELLGAMMELVGSLDVATWPLRQVIEGALETVLGTFPDRKLGGGFLRGSLARLPVLDSSARKGDGARPAGAWTVTGTLAELLEPGGRLASRLDDFEVRPGQTRMLELVYDILTHGGRLLIEAGTGTGKSLAYLLPAAAWAVECSDRVVLATNTINLQEQLWHKDLPLVREAAGVDFKACLVKGRANYVCLLRWQDLLREKEEFLTPEQRRFYLRMLTWLEETQTGDRSELNIFGPEEEFWQAVCAEADACSGKNCRLYNSCFLMASRREAEEAHLLIVNHSLLFADLKTENRLLPEFSRLICDEAHHLEDVATRQLARKVSNRQVMSLLAGIHSWQRRGYPGTLTLLEKWLKGLPGMAPGREGEGQAGDLEESLRRARELVGKAVASAEEFFGILRQLPERTGKGRVWGTSQNGSQGGESRQLRLGPEVLQSDLWSAAAVAGDNLVTTLKMLSADLAEIRQQWTRGAGDGGGAWDSTQEASNGREGRLFDLERHEKQLAQLAADLGFLLEGGDANHVVWLEAESREGGSEGYGGRYGYRCELFGAPVEVGPLLRETFYDRLESLILTSATLTVQGKFTYILDRLGINEGAPDLVTEVVDSPFDFASQALLCVPTDFPSPKGETAFGREVARFLRELVAITRGRTLVLFTSHRMLRSVYHQIRDDLEAMGLCLLGQGIDGGRTQLKAEFEADAQTVLFGSASFWEGIDIPGEALSCVVVVKLPFMPPDTPVVEARQERLESRGLSSFQHFTLPEAVIRFKQGFGRLIRRRSDRGAVIVLDPRVCKQRSSYGRHFIESLPGPRRFEGTSAAICSHVAAWLGYGMDG